jgi:hypothetical protein
MALAYESGGPGVLIEEKTEARKSRDTVPLNKLCDLFFLYQILCKIIFKTLPLIGCI